MQVVATPNGLIGGWISAVPANGTIAPGKLANVTLQYDISDSSFQGVYAANVLITTNARPVATVRLACTCMLVGAHDLSCSFSACLSSMLMPNTQPAISLPAAHSGGVHRLVFSEAALQCLWPHQLLTMLDARRVCLQVRTSSAQRCRQPLQQAPATLPPTLFWHKRRAPQQSTGRLWLTPDPTSMWMQSSRMPSCRLSGPWITSEAISLMPGICTARNKRYVSQHAHGTCRAAQPRLPAHASIKQASSFKCCAAAGTEL